MVVLIAKNTTPALAGGGELPAVAGFESARSADIVKGIEKDASIDTSELATKKDLEIIEERLTRKMYQTQIITIAILTGVMGIMLVMQGYFLMSLI